MPWRLEVVDEFGKKIEAKKKRMCLADSILYKLRGSDWREAAEGLHFKDVHLQEDVCGVSYFSPYDSKTDDATSGLHILIIRASKEDFSLKVNTSEKDCSESIQMRRQDPFSLEDAIPTTMKGAQVAASGGFIDLVDNSPVHAGLVVVDGKKISPPAGFGSGAIFSKQDQVDIVECYSDSDSSVSCGGIDWNRIQTQNEPTLNALQAGPRLVELNGDFGIRNNDYRRTARTAVGLDSLHIFFVAVRGRLNSGVSLYELARIFHAKPSDGGLGCSVALNLAGSAFASLGVRTPQNIVQIRGYLRNCSSLMLVVRGGR
jgi:hypothetical protein